MNETGAGRRLHLCPLITLEPLEPQHSSTRRGHFGRLVRLWYRAPFWQTS